MERFQAARSTDTSSVRSFCSSPVSSFRSVSSAISLSLPTRRGPEAATSNPNVELGVRSHVSLQCRAACCNCADGPVPGFAPDDPGPGGRTVRGSRRRHLLTWDWVEPYCAAVRLPMAELDDGWDMSDGEDVYWCPRVNLADDPDSPQDTRPFMRVDQIPRLTFCVPVSVFVKVSSATS